MVMRISLNARAGHIPSIRVVIVCLMFALSVMSYFDRTIISIAGPTIIKEFRLSETGMGTVFSAFTLGYALAMIPGGRFADRFGPRKVLTFMALGSALFTALTAFGAKPGLGALVGVVPALIIMRLGFGVCTAPLYPTCGRMNANWIPLTQRARVQGVVNAGAGFGGAVAPILFAWLIARIGWRFSFCVAAGITAALGIGWYALTRDYPALLSSTSGAADRIRQPRTPARPPKSTPWRILLTDWNVVLLTCGYLMVGYFQYIFFYWIFYYLREIRRLNAVESAVYTTMLFLTFGSLMTIGGWISDRAVIRYGRKNGYRIVGAGGLGLSAVLLYAGVNAQQTAMAVALMSLALGCSAVSDVTVWAAAIDVSGQEVGSVCGIVNAGGNVGGLISPIMSPLIAASFGWSSALYFGSIMAFIGLLIWLGVDATRAIDYTIKEASAVAATPPA